MDSGDLEREKGITILAKQTAVEYGGVRLNIVDTPGHADFGGEVERSPATWSTRCSCSSTPRRGRCRRRATCSRRRWPAGCRWSSPSTRSTARDARPAEVLDAVYELFMDLGADEHQIEFPVVYTNAKAGTATMDLAEPGTRPAAAAGPARGRTRRRRSTSPAIPLQLLVTNLSANDYVGRMAVGRVWNGTIRMGGGSTVVREERGATSTAASSRAGRSSLTGTVTSLHDRPGHRAGRHRGGRPGRHRRRGRACPRSRSATRSPTRPTRGPLPRLDVDAPDAAHDVRGQHLAAGRPRGQVT